MSAPERIGPYRIERLLGRGAWAAVWYGRSESGEPVAIKWIESADEGVAARFDREVRTLARLDHPGIVRMVGAGRERGRPWLAMEAVDGTDLGAFASKLHARPPAERYTRCRAIGVALCEALGAAHALGLVHRDVKPSNVLLGADGRVRLCDFGVVADLASGERTASGGFVGTLAWAAPEQIEGLGADARTDQYGVGATLYWVLALRRPERPVAAPPAHTDPGIPIDLEAAVMRLLASRPADRFRDMEEATAAIGGLVAAEGGPLSGLAGQERVRASLGACLERASAGDALVVRLRGRPGTGGRWHAETLTAAAGRRGLVALVATDEGSWRAARERLAWGERILVATDLDCEPPPGVAAVDVPVAPLGVADVRRTLVGAAPRTPSAARAAERLHRLSGGLPELIVPVLLRCVSDGVLGIPGPAALAAEAEPFFAGLDLDDAQVAAALAALGAEGEPAGERLIEDVAKVPARPSLDRLAARGVASEADGCWVLVADAFRHAALALAPDPDSLLEEAVAARAREMGGIVHGASEPADRAWERVEVAERLRRECRLGPALDEARRATALAAATGDRALECLALVGLGEVLLAVGMWEDAGRRLADAAALARAESLVHERRLIHALRARAALEARPGESAVAREAADRLLPLAKEPPGHDPGGAQALVLATLARAAAVLGDRRSVDLLRDAAIGRCRAEPSVRRRSVLLELARGELALGRTEAVAATLAELGSLDPDPIDRWEAAMLAPASGAPMPPLDGLEPREVDALRARFRADR